VSFSGRLKNVDRFCAAEIGDEEVSLYYIANEITTTYHGMMIAIPEPEWDVFYSMSTADL
jgi:hypothetical protein